jgi:hypothetical protein
MSLINYAGNGTDAIDFAKIKELNPLLEYCRDHGFELRRSGTRWVGKCLLHNELNGEAFVIHPDQKWQCYGRCGRSGDVTDLEQALHGGTLAEAAARLEGGNVRNNSAPINVIAVPAALQLVPTPSNPLALPYILTADEMQECQRYTLRLLEDREYLGMVAKARQWQEQNLHDLALDGYLGRDDEAHICFISAAGCKSRWRENAERRFRFLFGRSWLWRGELIPGAQTVYLCEGETDVVTLIDRGIEDDGETIAVGVQGATLNIAPWAFLFTDKHVVIAMDDDEAGWKADAKIESVLSQVAISIEHFWSGKELAQSWT